MGSLSLIVGVPAVVGKQQLRESRGLDKGSASATGNRIGVASPRGRGLG